MSKPFIVGDLGNSALKLGEFKFDAGGDTIPIPKRTFRTRWDELNNEDLDRWLDQSVGINSNFVWTLGSVNQSVLHSVTKRIEGRGDVVRLVSHVDFSMPIILRNPERVGIDRLAAAFAAHAMCPPHHAAIVIDAGTAITIDCVTADGQFIGGCIAPGMQLCLQSLHSNTDQLPLENMKTVPTLIGDNTTDAIRSGVYWMTNQGIEGMIEKLKAEMASPCVVFVTGGAMPLLLPNLNESVRHFPNLVLSGLAMTHR